MKKVFIVGAKRTAIGTFGGTLKDVPAVEIGVTASKAAIEHSKVDPKNIEEAIDRYQLGQVFQLRAQGTQSICFVVLE